MEKYRQKAFLHYEKILTRMQGRSEKDIRIHFNLFRKNLLPHIPQNKQVGILDLGSGFGDILAFLSGEGYTDVQGVDLSLKNVEFIRKRGLAATHSECRQFLTAQVRRFDCVILYDVLEHQKKNDAMELLETIYTNLNQGGCVLIVVPNMGNPLTAARGRYADITHEAGYSEESLAFLLELSGFDAARILPIDHFVLPNPVLNLIGRTVLSVVYLAFKVLHLLHGITTTTVYSKNMLAVGRKA